MKPILFSCERTQYACANISPIGVALKKLVYYIHIILLKTVADKDCDSVFFIVAFAIVGRIDICALSLSSLFCTLHIQYPIVASFLCALLFRPSLNCMASVAAAENDHTKAV